MLLSVAGEDVLEVFNNFSFSEGESKEDYETVVSKFDAYWAAQTNEVYKRYLFRKRMQTAGEYFEQFSRDVRMQARSCNFGQLTDSMIRDQIVIGISNGGLRAKLLQDNELTLAKAEKMCKPSEAAAQQCEAWAHTVNQVEQVFYVARASTKHPKIFKCSRCGKENRPRDCPAP